MAGIAGLKCPECGREHRNERKLHKRRLRWRFAASAVIILLTSISLAMHTYASTLPQGWWEILPTDLVVLAGGGKRTEAAMWELYGRWNLHDGEASAKGTRWQRRTMARRAHDMLLDPASGSAQQTLARFFIDACSPEDARVQIELLMKDALAAPDCSGALRRLDLVKLYQDGSHASLSEASRTDTVELARRCGEVVAPLEILLNERPPSESHIRDIIVLSQQDAQAALVNTARIVVQIQIADLPKQTRVDFIEMVIDTDSPAVRHYTDWISSVVEKIRSEP